MSLLSCELIIREHLSFLGGQFSCVSDGGRLWIVSPYAFPDGDYLEVTVTELPSGEVRVSDLGETLRHLANLGFDPRATPKGEYLIAEMLKQHRSELDRGMITKKVPSSEAGKAIQDVLMTSLAIAHLIFLARGYRPATFNEEVAHLLLERNVKFEPRYKVVGHSGTQYDFDFLIRGKHQDGLIVTLAPLALSGVTAAVNSTLRKWHDVKNGYWHGTMLDDRLVKWRPNDLFLLDSVSEVYRWTQRETFERVLAERAQSS